MLKNIVPSEGKSSPKAPLVKKKTRPAVSENIPRYTVVVIYIMPVLKTLPLEVGFQNFIVSDIK
jgi:hypothetical protein